MYETARAGNSDFVLLLDDDAISEPESILRAIQFSDYTVRPVLVGGGMFHLDNRTMLYTQGERINPQRMWMYHLRTWDTITISLWSLFVILRIVISASMKTSMVGGCA